MLSSRIEGTQASLDQLLLFEAAGKPEAEEGDVREVSNYVAALELGLRRLREIPLSLRFLREVHERLMRDVRGANRAPGEFRRVQNWIGPPGSDMAHASYIPPPPREMHEALDAFEKFIHAPSSMPPLIRFALIHYQFGAIHPFLDGNGRVGRLLLTFLFHIENLLEQPLLYLSAFFEEHRAEYYRRLREVSTRGAWAEWIDYFLRAVATQADDGVTRAERLLDLHNDYRNRVSSGVLLRAVDRLFEVPALTVVSFAREMNVTYRAAKQNVEKLVAAGILTEPATDKRKKIYMAREIIARIDESSS